MKEEKDGSFWASLPGMLTSIATLITAISGWRVAIEGQSAQTNSSTSNVDTATIYILVVMGSVVISFMGYYIYKKFQKSALASRKKRNLSLENEGSFWTSLAGLITATATLATTFGGLFVASRPDFQQASLPAPQIELIVAVSVMLVLTVILYSINKYFSEKREKKIPKAKKIKARYPGLSVVGVFLDKSRSTHIVAQNILSLTLGLYVMVSFLTPLPTRWDAVIIIALFLAMLLLDNFITQFRIKKGYYLNNEEETRDIIKFIRDNADDIDFTDGDRKILSKNDLEEIVLGQVGYNPV